MFIAHALLFASWTAHIPQIRASLDLSDASLGTALLGAPIGSIAAMTIAGWLLPRIGSHRMVQITVVGYAVFGVTVGLADSITQLFVALAMWGVFQGSLDVAMNTQGATVEKALGRSCPDCTACGVLAASVALFSVRERLPSVRTEHAAGGARGDRDRCRGRLLVRVVARQAHFPCEIGGSRLEKSIAAEQAFTGGARSRRYCVRGDAV